MKTDIKRIIEGNDVYKLITIATDNGDVIFEAKLYCDSSKFKTPVNENELMEKILEIPKLFKYVQ
jgi:hypothetical protein